jgi:peptidoglycan hydrolase-like protein with peptidoglycan-binding domain
MRGVQRRASMLGYQMGAVDGILGPKTDRGVLNFQADNNLVTDSIAGPKTHNALTSKVGE